MRIILARHGQTEWNAQQTFRGRADIPLDVTGIQQATALAVALEKYTIRDIYASPLVRALKTAQIVGERVGVKVVVANELIELDCGSWQGMPLTKVKATFPGMYEKWCGSPQSFVFPAGEDLSIVRARVDIFLSWILKENIPGDVLIVSHRIINKVILCSLLQLDNSYFGQFKQEVGAFHVIDFVDARAVVVALNEIVHLNGLLMSETSDF